MPIINLSFEFDLNVSVQPTDILYIALCNAQTNNQAGTNHQSAFDTKPEAYGIIVGVDHDNNLIWVDTDGYNVSPHNSTITQGHYLFFSKDRRANTSGIIGYYAEVEYRNYTKLQAEMFATATEFVESSK